MTKLIPDDDMYLFAKSPELEFENYFLFYFITVYFF